MATLWVDDYFMMGKKEFTKYLQVCIKKVFTVGRVATDEFKYLGIKTERSKDGTFKQSQEDYIQSLEKVDIPKRLDKEELDEYRLSILRHGTGMLN